jgi:hypothetical protein
MVKPRATDDFLEELNGWITSDISRWADRNTRFQRDQDCYRLTQPAELQAKIQTDITILNDPRVLVRKVARLIARHPNIIEVPAAPGTDGVVAQNIENLLYIIDQGINQAWMLGGHHPYRYEQAFYVVLRGWLAERTMIRADYDEDEFAVDPSVLFDHQVFDPANVYPYWANNRLVRVTHAYTATARDLRDDPMFSKSLGELEDPDDNTLIQVKAVYWRDSADGGYWHAVTLGSGHLMRGLTNNDTTWVKKPTELGYMPWNITLAQGSPYDQTPWDEIDYLAEKGEGILSDTVENHKQMNRMVTKLTELLSLESNPPVTVKTTNGDIRLISFEPGARNFLAAKDSIEAHRIGPAMGDYQLLWDILQQRAARGGLPAAFFAEYGGESGFSAATILAAGKDVLFPFSEGVNQADALKYRHMLRLYRDFGPSKPLPSRTQRDGMGRVLSADVSEDDIRRQGTYVEITREEMTPQELAQRVNLGIALAREKLLSLETARKDWIKVRNPKGENLKILAEQTYLSEDVIKALIPVALTSTGQEQLRKVWEMVQNPVPPEPQQLPPGMPQMPPPGQMPQQGPPQPMPPQMPQPMPQGPPQGPPQAAAPPMLPAAALPPNMQNGNLAQNVQVGAMDPAAAMMNQLMAAGGGAGVLGGAGSGGLPPVPGTGQPVAPTPPPGALLQMLLAGRRP